MSNSICIINFSEPEIQIVVLDNSQLKDRNFNLSWDVGFRKESDDNFFNFFGQDIMKLDPNAPGEVRFRDFYEKFRKINDIKALEYFFIAYLAEIFKQLPESDYLVYTITPYRWKSIHRQQLRKALKQLKLEAPVAFLKQTEVTLRGMISQILCLSAYYQKVLSDIPIDAKEYHLFMIDFRVSDFVVYQTLWGPTDDDVKIVLNDILQFTKLETRNKVTSLKNRLDKAGEELPVVVGFSGKIGDSDIAKTSIPLIKAWCKALFIEQQETATLLGATELVRQFQERDINKNLHLIYHFCFGVQLPNGQLIELVPANWIPAYHRKRAFQVTGIVEKFDVHLVCGLSMNKNSDVIRLATHEIIPPEDKEYNLRSPMEFLLSVTLNDYTHGTFGLHTPNPEDQKSVDFTVPVLMD